MNKKSISAFIFSRAGCFPRALLILLITLYGQVLAAQPVVVEGMRLSVPMYDTIPINELYSKAQGLTQMKPDSAIVLFKQGMVLSRAQGYTKGQAQHTIALAQMIAQQGNLEQGIPLFRRAKILCIGVDRPALWVKYHQCGSFLYQQMGYNDTALQHAYKMLDICNKFPGLDSTGALSGLAYCRLGASYMNSGADPHLAITFFKKALQIAERNGSKEQYPFLYTGLAGSWVNINTLDSTSTEGFLKGIQLYLKAMNAALELNDHVALFSIYYNLGAVYGNLEKFDSSAYYLEKMAEMPEAVVSPDGKIVAYDLLAISLVHEKEYDKAAHYFELSESLARQHGARRRLLDIARHQYTLHRSRGHYKAAMEHLEQYLSLRDSLLNEEKIQATTQLEVKYKVAQKDKVLAEKDLRLTRQKSALKEKNIWIGAISLSGLFLAGLLLVWRRNSQHRRQLQVKQIRFMEQEQALWKQGESIRNLNAMIRGEEKERARLGRELHDGIVSELVAIKMNFDTLQAKYPLYEAESEYEKALRHLDDTARELRKTAQNLMPDVLTEHGLRMSLVVYCEKTSALTGLNIRFVCEDHLPQFPLDFELSLYRMVQELVLNILKHAQASSALVQLNYNPQLLMLTVEDNGKGIDMADAGLSGIGLSNLKSRVEALQGRFDIRVRKSGGTAVNVEFDLPLLQSLMTDEN